MSRIHLTSDSDCDIKGCLVRAVLNETLRLFPSVGINQRGTTATGSVLPPTRPGEKPLYVAPHTDTYLLVLNLHRDPDVWGEDSLVFDPDRWIDPERMKLFLNNPLIFIPFNAGPRTVRPCSCLL